MPESTEKTYHLLAVDCHVHIYDWLNLVPMLDAALSSFSRAVKSIKGEGAVFSGVLALTEPAGRDTFAKLQAQLDVSNPCRLGGQWTLLPTGESLSLIAEHAGGKRLYLISGQQIVTDENLEVLSLLTEQDIPDQKSLADTISIVQNKGGLPLLPWGVGKWLFGRGKIISQAISENTIKPLALCDNGGRPVIWQKVAQFEQARRYDLPILRGSDPLRVDKLRRTAGSFGTLIHCSFDEQNPGATLIQALADNSCERIDFGSLDNPAHFIVDQLLLRIT